MDHTLLGVRLGVFLFALSLARKGAVLSLSLSRRMTEQVFGLAPPTSFFSPRTLFSDVAPGITMMRSSHEKDGAGRCIWAALRRMLRIRNAEKLIKA